MIKTGIYNLDQLKRSTNFATRKKVSITLYKKIQNEPNTDELAERILFSFADERGAYKRTYAKRFEEFDQMALSQLKSMLKRDEFLLVQDVGVSDGKTSVDFFEKLSSTFTNLKYIASDYNPKVYLLEQGKQKVILSQTGKILEIVFPPFVFNTIKRYYLRYPLNLLVRFIVQFLFTSSILKAYKAGKIKAQEIILFNPKAIRLQASDPRFILTQYDLLQPFKEHAQVIRVMNVLNPSYFSRNEIIKIIINIHSFLSEGGALITGSNQDAGSVVHGGVYRKISNGFQKVEQCGKGSPFDKLILNINEIK